MGSLPLLSLVTYVFSISIIFYSFTYLVYSATLALNFITALAYFGKLIFVLK
jgi:hypothetical protein